MGPDPYSIVMLQRIFRTKREVHLTLRGVREGTGKTQVEVRAASSIDQADISRLEARENLYDCQASTLQRYLAALGGRLDLVAVFGDKRIILTGAQPEPLADTALRSLKRKPTGKARRRG
jgi:hypothetical protein